MYVWLLLFNEMGWTLPTFDPKIEGYDSL